MLSENDRVGVGIFPYWLKKIIHSSQRNTDLRVIIFYFYKSSEAVINQCLLKLLNVRRKKLVENLELEKSVTLLY